MGGRRCEIPQQAHFTATLDFLLYEAELARGSPVSCPRENTLRLQKQE